MRASTAILVVLAAGLAAAGGYGAYRHGMSRGMQMNSAAPAGSEKGAAAKAGDIDPATGKKVLYWHDPMVPGQKFDKPGKSPFMDMQLVPVYAGAEGDEGKVTISPRVQQNLGVRTAEVVKGSLSPAVEVVGSIAYNERNVAVVTARANGYVERLHARAPLDPVRRGQTLAEIYVPDWVAAQEEFLTVKRMAGMNGDVAPLLDGARQRMRLAGMTEEQIRRFESTGNIQPRVTITAPVSGVIAELGAREGMTVMSGAALFRINGLDTVWVNAELPESQARLVRPGNAVEARTPAFPETTFKGRVGAILPEIAATTRTLKARIELDNPGHRLVPGMFATLKFTPLARKEVLLVPTEAVIQTGTRSVVIVADGDGGFVPVDVEVGVEAAGQSEIRSGLQAGQKVVVSGQFLLDSEASLRSTATRMQDMPASETGKPADAVHRGEGKVESIGKDEVILSHGPMPSLQWDAMTMGFRLPPDTAPNDLRVGDTVAFEIRQGRDGTFEITKMSRIGPPAGKSGAKNNAAGSAK
jgi:membrane fusion protein, copper/silver efflux system